MNSVPIEPVRWSRRRWWAVVLLVLALHLGMIFRLREPPHVSGARSRPIRLHFAASTETQPSRLPLAFISDPTLFALPSQGGFSGKAWLKVTPREHSPADWSESPTWLTLPSAGLGQAFSRFIATNSPAAYHIADQPLPTATILDVVVPGAMVETQSVLRVQGDLARRRMLAPLRLPSWPHTDVLANSVVQVIVDGTGLTISARLLVESGLAAADQVALRLAKMARFQPLRSTAQTQPPESAMETTVGKLIFDWHTVPMAATNTPTEVR